MGITDTKHMQTMHNNTKKSIKFSIYLDSLHNALKLLAELDLALRGLHRLVKVLTNAVQELHFLLQEVQCRVEGVVHVVVLARLF